MHDMQGARWAAGVTGGGLALCWEFANFGSIMIQWADYFGAVFSQKLQIAVFPVILGF